MSEREAAIQALLRAIESGGLGALEVEPPPEHGEILRLCAILPTFTSREYEHLRPHAAVTLPPLEDLAEWPDVEPVPQTHERYRVRNRHAVLGGWSDGETPRRIAAALTKELEESSIPPQEWLDLLVRGRDPSATERLAALCDAADDRDDLPSFNDIVSAASSAADPSDAALQQALTSLRTYYSARLFWRQDAAAAHLYIERHLLKRAFEELIEPSAKKWLLDIYATGGMGKTSALRTLIARRCVPRQYRIPVARINFQVDSVLKATDGTLLLDTVAEQFDRQMTGSPFVNLRNSIASYLSSAGTTHVGGLGPIEGSEAEYIQRFAEILSATRRDAPAVLIFDTIEIPLLHHGDQMRRILELVKEMHRKAPMLRVIMAGRYSLTKKLGSLGELRREVRQIRVRPFQPVEAETYLAMRRDVTDPDVLAAVVRKCGGFPYKLALFGDILRNGKMTVQRIEEYADDSVAYLVERILEHLDRDDERPLQWILRYGAIPRKLTLEFLEEVTLPFLRAARKGKPISDDPFQGLPKSAETTLFFAEDAPASELAKFWDKLKEYAGTFSWISVDSVSVDTLILGSEVVDPMRRLLGDHDVFRLLHEKAIRYFDRKAKKEKSTEAFCEALYHRFQIGAPDAEGLWRKGIDDAHRAGDLERAAQIAAEITRDEYLDELAPRLRRHDGQPIASRKLIAEAFTIDARLRLRRAVAGDPSAWDEAAVSVEKAQALYNVAGVPHPPELLIADAMVLAHNGDEKALDHISQPFPTAGLELSRLLTTAEALGARNKLEASCDAYVAASTAARELGFYSGARRPKGVLLEREEERLEDEIALPLASLQRGLGRYQEALEELRRIRDLNVERGENLAAELWQWHLANTHMELLRPVVALRAVAFISTNNPMILAGNARVHADALWQQFAAIESRAAAEEAIHLVAECREANLNEGITTAVASGSNFALGRALAELFKVEEARSAFIQSIAEIEKTGNPFLLSSVLAEIAEIEIEQFGVSEYVLDWIKQLQRIAASTRSSVISARALYLMLRANVAAGKSHDWEAPDTLDPDAVGPTETLMILCGVWSVRALAGKIPEPAEVETVASTLQRVTPAEARPVLLRRLAACPRPLPAFDASKILALLPDDERLANATPRLRLAQIDVLRVLGQHERAVTMFRNLERTHHSPKPLLARALFAAAERLGIRKRTRPTKKLQQYDKQLRATYPGLLAMLYLDQASRFVHDPDTARRLIAEATALDVSGEAKTFVDARAARIGGKLPVVGPKPAALSAAAPRSGRPYTTIKFSRSSRGTDMVVTPPDGLLTLYDLPPFMFVTKSTRDGAATSYWLAEAIANGSATLGLRDWLPPVSLGDDDVCLVIDEREWQQFPWELGFAVPAPFRSITRINPRLPTIPESIFHVSSVVVMAPPAEALSVGGRWRPLGQVREWYSPVRKISSARDFEQLRTAGKYDDPSIIHLCVTFEEHSRSGSIVANFPGARRVMAPRDLGAVLNGIEPRPIVVLDPPAAESPTETAVQLLLRNAYAAELFNLGAFSAVLATGLFENWEDAGMAAVDVQRGIENGIRICDLLKPSESIGSSWAAGPVALFASDPEMRIVCGPA